jgi:glycopeptide antibiotics resistance protein
MRQIIEYMPGALLLALMAAVIAAAAHRLVRRTGVRRLAAFSVVTFISAAYILMAYRILFSVTKFGIYGNPEPWYGNYIPFATIWEYIDEGNPWLFLMQVAGNVLITLPLPLVLRFYLPRLRMKRVGAVSLIITALIEPVQLLINMVLGGPSNIIDVDDLILNLVGCGLGLWLMAAITRLRAARAGRIRNPAADEAPQKNK